MLPRGKEGRQAFARFTTEFRAAEANRIEANGKCALPYQAFAVLRWGHSGASEMWYLNVAFPHKIWQDAWQKPGGQEWIASH
ncbi:MAG TPA: hypothetical protein VHY82_04110, partial [Acetobacteraceae bacterium]|nr:hypothetical protein [Acetobacteraceae bacterium]